MLQPKKIRTRKKIIKKTRNHSTRWPQSKLRKYVAEIILFRKHGLSLRQMAKNLSATHGEKIDHTTVHRYIKKILGK